MSECLFCKIAGHEIDSEIVHETEDSVAFRDINPTAPTHVLVIPKKHVASAHDLGDDDSAILADVFATIRRVADEAGVSGGYRVVTNIGADAGQSVGHLHFHVIGGRTMSWPPG